MKRADITTIDVLKACNGPFEIGNSPFQKLKAKFVNYPEKIIYAAMLRDEKAGLIDYGTSIRGAFITKEGEEFLKHF